MKEILRAINLLAAHSGVVELRVIDCKDGNYSANYTGYFDNFEKMAEAAKRFDGSAPAVYMTLNRCKSSLLARAANRVIKAGKKSISTSDRDIENYCWLPIDADAKRPAGISSSNEEHFAAIQRVDAIAAFLQLNGWPDPIKADSGNGAHILYRIDLPNTAENVDLVKSAIMALHEKFSDDIVEIDRTVFNPARIWKIYGTLAKKGDATEERPHRRAKLLTVPDQAGLVSVDQLKFLAALAAKDQKQVKPVQKNTTSSSGSIDVEQWCNDNGLTINFDASWKDGQKFQVTPCPFNSDHSEAIIIKHPSGAVSFKCLHSGCAGKTWQDLREKIAPKPEPRKMEQRQDPPRKKPEGIYPRVDSDGDLSAMFNELESQEAGERITLPMPWNRLSTGSNALRPGSMMILAGPLKTGKSFFTMNIIKNIADLGYDWAYLPLEDDRIAWGWRMLALMEQDYRMIDADQIGAKLRMGALARKGDVLADYLKRVTQNPRVGVKNSLGETIIPEVTHTKVLGWIARAAKKARVIVVDPISQIEFNGREAWKLESEFVRNALGIISDTDATLILVAHTVKRSGLNATVDLSAEDVQGSSMYTRLAHTTILLDACDMKEGNVYAPGGQLEPITYNRVVTIAAARNGSSSRSRIAFLQDKNRPHFEELGYLAPSGKKKGQR